MSEVSSPAWVSALEIPRYRERDFRDCGHWVVEATKLKVYAITRPGKTPTVSESLAAAKSYTDANLPSLVAQEGHDHGLGYVILHAGEMSNWLLVHWWAYGDIALRLLASCDHGLSEFSSQDHRRFHACVWEHVVIDHERDAWVRHMSREDRTPEQYLEDRLANGQY